MKIVMLCDFYNETLEYQENHLTKYYTKHGHEVTVITSTFDSVFDYYNDRHDNADPGRTYYDRGAKIIKLPYRYNILNKLRAYPRIDRILDQVAPDLIFVHDIMLNFPDAIRYVRSHPNCCMIMDYHADYSNSGKSWLSRKILHGVIRKWFLDRARPHLRQIFAFTPGAIRFLHEIYKVPLKRIELLPLGADLDLCAEVKSRKEGAELRRSLGIGDDTIVIFTGGKLEPWKRTEVVIEAVKSLSKHALELVVVGDTDRKYKDYKSGLHEAAKFYMNIRFVGWLEPSAIYKYLDMADLAVFPSGQSVLWQQAIAMGLPLIVGNKGHEDSTYLNLHGNAVMVGTNEITFERFAREIESIITSPERMRSMSGGALRTADEILNWDKLVAKTLRYNQPANNIAGKTT